MKSVFFGDSLTAGENNEDISFADYMPGTTWNFGVSGTTIGEYSIYPVDGHSLLGMIPRAIDRIKDADHIFIEYGCNDVAAIMCGFATVQTVTVSFVKAIDWIKQINPNAQLIFLSYAPDNSAPILDLASSECTYLSRDYFKDFDFTFPIGTFQKYYSEIVQNISKICDIMYMFDSDTYSRDWISDDDVHPNNKGHLEIMHNLLKSSYSIL